MSSKQQGNRLRAVSEDDVPPPRPKPATIKAATECSELELLIAMRDKISSEIDSGVPPHTLAPLMRQLRDLDKEIRSLAAREQDSGEDDRSGGDSFDASAI